VDTKLAAELTPQENLSVGAAWDFRLAGTSDSQTFSIRSTRLEPVAIGAEADRNRASDGSASYRWGLGADVPLTRDVQLGASYRGEPDEDGSGHGARGRLSVRWQAPGVHFKDSLDGRAVVR